MNQGNELTRVIVRRNVHRPLELLCWLRARTMMECLEPRQFLSVSTVEGPTTRIANPESPTAIDVPALPSQGASLLAITSSYIEVLDDDGAIAEVYEDTSYGYGIVCMYKGPYRQVSSRDQIAGAETPYEIDDSRLFVFESETDEYAQADVLPNTAPMGTVYTRLTRIPFGNDLYQEQLERFDRNPTFARGSANDDTSLRLDLDYYLELDSSSGPRVVRVTYSTFYPERLFAYVHGERGFHVSTVRESSTIPLGDLTTLSSGAQIFRFDLVNGWVRVEAIAALDKPSTFYTTVEAVDPSDPAYLAARSLGVISNESIGNPEDPKCATTVIESAALPSIVDTNLPTSDAPAFAEVTSNPATARPASLGFFVSEDTVLDLSEAAVI